MNTAELSSMSKQVRRDIINMTANVGSGHPGGSLSAADLMTCLFFNHMHVDPKHPDDPDRDRFVLSKGHSTPTFRHSDVLRCLQNLLYAFLFILLVETKKRIESK